MQTSWKWKLIVCGLGFLGCSWILQFAEAQIVYEWDQNPIVRVDGETLANPWSGGLNAPQFSNLDLDQDGVQDLVVFDRANNKISTYLVENGSQNYAPQYESMFPQDINGWMLLRDFNCDGINDLFAHTNLGIKVYQNTTLAQGQLSWLLVADPLLTQGSSGNINLQINVQDLPAIFDIDSDGDIDILTYDFAVGGGIEFHKNLSIEETGMCGIQFQRVTRRWGEFDECDCDLFAFGDEQCSDLLSRIKHVGGKTILTLDTDGDGDQEAIIGQEDCFEIAFLENFGDTNDAMMETHTSQFPANNPIDSYSFPSVFAVDINGDLSNELIASTNFSFNRGNEIDFAQSISVYTNVGSIEFPEFEFQTANFLQSQSIDIGEEASPAFADFDRDGDEDLFISHKGKPANGALISSIWLFRNTGSASGPSFELETRDYAGLSSLELSHVKIQFIDLDLDSNLDLVFQGSDDGNSADLFFIPNESNSVFSFDMANRQNLNIEGLGSGDHFHFTIVNSSNQPDLLVAKSQGALELHSHTGSNSPTFSLTNETYLGIENDFSRKNLTVTSGFFDQDDELDLLTSNEKGNLTVFSSFRSNSPDVETILMALDENAIPAEYNVGNITNLASTGVFADSQTTIAVGLKTGGIQLLRASEATPISPGNGEALSLIAFPNPTVNSNLLTIVVNKDASIEVLNPAGQLLLANITATAGTSVRLQTGLFEQGLYLVKACSETGELVTKRVVFY